MNAGDELNALVAEKVMGWEVVTGDEAVQRTFGAKLSQEDLRSDRWHRKKAWFVFDRLMACEECGTLPQFSTSIADAWLVVEKLCQVAHGNVDLSIESDDVCCTYTSSTHDAQVIARSAPLAICLAALQASGVQIDDQT